MKSSIVWLILLAGMTGCSQDFDRQAEVYTNLSFDLCGSISKVNSFALTKDGKMRISCDQDRHFFLKDQDSLAYANELNGMFCDGQGFTSFRERKSGYFFECIDNKRFHLPK